MEMVIQINRFHPVFVYAIAHAAMEIPYIYSYGQEYLDMMRNVAKDTTAPNNQKLYAVIAYAIFAIATYVLVFKEILENKKSLSECIMWAMLYAGAVYGVFNFTNLVAFNEYKFDLALRDLLYGVVSIIILAMLAFSMRIDSNPT